MPEKKKQKKKKPVSAKMAQTPWMAVGAPLGVLGSQLPPPFSYWCFTAAAICTMLYGTYHYRERSCPLPHKEEDDNNDKSCDSR